MILGFDPGRDKCGIALMDERGGIIYHQVVESGEVMETVQHLCQKHRPRLMVMGNQTTSKNWQEKITENLVFPLPVVAVDEKNSSLEARDRYWQMYPPRGFERLIPQGMRLPPRPIDDIVAILLIERYLESEQQNGIKRV